MTGGNSPLARELRETAADRQDAPPLTGMVHIPPNVPRNWQSLMCFIFYINVPIKH